MDPLRTTASAQQQSKRSTPFISFNEDLPIGSSTKLCEQTRLIISRSAFGFKVFLPSGGGQMGGVTGHVGVGEFWFGGFFFALLDPDGHPDLDHGVLLAPDSQVL
jgi:hypothetical protein